MAMLGVIIIHISSPLVNMTFGKNMTYWWIGNVWDSAVRFAVPLFLMLSGATMLGKNYKLSEFYKKRITKVLYPFLFWMIIYWVFRWAMLLPKQQPHGLSETIKWALNLFLNEGISKHFWYIYMILFIYLFLPFLGKFVQKLRNIDLILLLICWVMLTFLCRSVPFNMYRWSGDFGSKFLGYFLFSGYLVAGYFLTKIHTSERKIKIPLAVIFMVSIALIALTANFMSEKAHRLNLSVYSYTGLLTIIQSVTLFAVVKDIEIKNVFLQKMFSIISSYSYGIYLVHIIIIGILFRNGIYWSFAHPLISVPVLTIGVLLLSFSVIFVLRKAPLGKHIAG